LGARQVREYTQPWSFSLQRWELNLLTVYEVSRTGKLTAYKEVKATVGSRLTEAISESAMLPNQLATR